MKKRKIVLNDKAKIAAVIEELDQKKNEALTKAWEQVNKVHMLYTVYLCTANTLLLKNTIDKTQIHVIFCT